MRSMMACIAIATMSGACRGRTERAHATPALDVVAGDAGPGTAITSSVVSVPSAPSQGCAALRPEASRWQGTVHAPLVIGNETWTPEGSPHRLPDGVVIARGASVTFTPCTLVITSPDHAIVVADGGALFAMGERARPVRFSGLADGTGWRGIRFERGARTTSRMQDVFVEFATIEQELPSFDATRVRVAGTVYDAAMHDARGSP